MSEPFLCEIRLFALNFAPGGWAFCDGQILPINQNQSLFSLLGTTYGGDGRTTFALPNLQGRVPVHQGAGLMWGQAGGEEAHTLTVPELPEHTHTVRAGGVADASDPSDRYWGHGSTVALYGPSTDVVDMAQGAVSWEGGGQPHQNMPPYLALNFCIALRGLYPQRD